jgi:hypothetical protein
MRARRETTEGFDRAHAESAPPSSESIDAPLAEHPAVALPTSDDSATEASRSGDAVRAPGVSLAPFVSATHAALFVADETVRCDVCNAVVAEDADDGYAVAGRGLYVWARGDDVRYEEPHLCAGCAAAVGVSALARWEIEEEEG